MSAINQKRMDNVSRLNQNRVFNHIHTFVEDYANKSKNTPRAYLSDIKQFFYHIHTKNIEQLEIEDLHVSNSQVKSYRTFLKQKKGDKNTTINRKMNTIKSLYDSLKTEYDVDLDALIIKNRLPDDSTPIGFLSPDEVLIGMTNCIMQHETHNKYMKRALVVLAFATSMREDALLRLKYDHIRQDENNPDRYLIEPDFLDKGKKIRKQIHVDVYNLLLEAKEKDARIRTDDKIFTMDAKGIGQMMRRICDKMGIDPRRNVSFHSIRKAGADFVYEITGGDIFAVTAQGNWSNPKIVMDRYLEKQDNLAGMAAFEKIDEDVFEQLTHEELLKLVKGIGNGLGMKLKSEAQRIVNGREVVGDREKWI